MHSFRRPLYGSMIHFQEDCKSTLACSTYKITAVKHFSHLGSNDHVDIIKNYQQTGGIKIFPKVYSMPIRRELSMGRFNRQLEMKLQVRTVKVSSLLCVSLLLLLDLFLLGTATSKTCSPGTYLRDMSNAHFYDCCCIECPDGTFMPYTDHQETECRQCEMLEDIVLEILMSPCNKTHDTVIHCVDGYYRDQARNPRKTGRCQKCTKCSDHIMVTGQPCSTYRDSVCCMDENFDVSPNHHGVPLCRERPWFCRLGQYFDTGGFQCLPCPRNTFMPIDLHVRLKCFECIDYATFELNSPLLSVIVQPCNSTHDTVLKCQDGFFIKHTMGYRSDAIGCSPCTDCSTTGFQYDGRKCDSMNDTVCCPHPNMTVVDRSDGPVCLGPSSSCGKGFCEQHNARTKQARCGRCWDQKEGEHFTEVKLDYPDDDSKRELTPDDHLDCTGNISNKKCNENEESEFKVACIVLAVLCVVLLFIVMAILIHYCYKKQLYHTINN